MFTDYVLWDGIWIDKHLKMAPHGFDIMVRMWQESGRSYDLIWLAPLKGLANPAIISKYLSVTSWILSSVLFYFFLISMRIANPTLCLMAAFLAVSAPFNDLLGDLNQYLYVIPVCFFWAGMLALVVFSEQKTKAQCLVVRILALTLLFLSFSLASNLVFFCAVFLLYIFANSTGTSLREYVSRALTQAKSHADFAVLPFISWGLRRTFYVASGTTKDYNTIHFDVEKILEVYSTALRSLTGKYEINFSESWIWFLSIFLALLTAVVIMRKKTKFRVVSFGRQPSIFIVVGLVLWIAVVFPYAAVGQYIHAWGWSTRNAVLFNIPYGLFSAGALVQLSRLLLPCRPRAVWFPIVVVAGLGIGMSNASYLRFQAQGAKQSIIAQTLRDLLSDQKNVSLVQLRDYYPLSFTFPFYPTFIWTYLISPQEEMPKTLVIEATIYALDKVEIDEFGQSKRIFSEIEVTTTGFERLVSDTTLPYVMDNIPRGGRQLLVVIMPGSLGSNSVQLGSNYLIKKYFQPGRLNEFLSDLIMIHSKEISSIHE